ncbi:hypothetical protein [Serratia marcescens]|uniref:hypothetical protein n=1 Tax=Serratia marcescens TaxID=615 RepID=UPI0021ACD509|nr:hypothetical protein [Serratia marcescens]
MLKQNETANQESPRAQLVASGAIMREALREFFEVNRHFIALATLKLLADEGRIARNEVNRAMVLYGIAPDKPDPAAVK